MYHLDIVYQSILLFMDKDNFSILVLSRTGAENYINITLNCIWSRHNNQTWKNDSLFLN